LFIDQQSAQIFIFDYSALTPNPELHKSTTYVIQGTLKVHDYTIQAGSIAH